MKFMPIIKGSLVYLPNGNGPFVVTALGIFKEAEERANVFWLDKEDKPHREIFPIDILSIERPKLL